MAAIAVISLVVGGIGVMNIMLVSVSERISEIGVRMAVGARRSDILQQFLVEATLISSIGGIAGILIAILLGVAINIARAGIPGQLFDVLDRRGVPDLDRDRGRFRLLPGPARRVPRPRGGAEP